MRIVGDLRRRYESYVQRGGPDECWLWTGPTDAYGYGVLKVERRMRKATHIGWELLHGKPFPGPMTCHTCDVALCQNPRHWYLGGHQQNNADKVARDRCSRLTGERNGRATTTWAIVEELRRRHTGKYGEVTALAKEFGLDRSVVSAIVNYKTWVSQSAAVHTR